MSTPSIVIRPERPDHPEVRELLRQLDAYLGALYEPQDNHILDERALLAADVTFLVASQEQRIVGCGAVRRMPAEHGSAQRPYGEVKRMMVDPRLRGRRIGARLLQSLESLLRAEGIDLIHVARGGGGAIELTRAHAEELDIVEPMAPLAVVGGRNAVRGRTRTTRFVGPIDMHIAPGDFAYRFGLCGIPDIRDGNDFGGGTDEEARLDEALALRGIAGVALGSGSIRMTRRKPVEVPG